MPFLIFDVRRDALRNHTPHAFQFHFQSPALQHIHSVFRPHAFHVRYDFHRRIVTTQRHGIPAVHRFSPNALSAFIRAPVLPERNIQFFQYRPRGIQVTVQHIRNEDNDVDGFIVQLPLPKHISEQKVIETIDYRKDVDGFHPINVGRMSIGLPCYVSATPNGILELLKRYEIETSGKKCVVLGRSNIVGKPMAALMMQKAYPGDATVTVCHSRSKDLIKECQEADIIIAALGQPNFVKAEMVKEGAVVIDVGTTRMPDATKKSGFKLTGDVKFDEVAPKCSFITPVPGGVGPMTIVSLMKNTLLAGKKAIYQ